MHIITQLSSALALTALTACMSAPSGGGLGPSVDESSFMLSVQNYRTSGQFTEVTTKAYPSTVASGANIRVWISSFAATAYRQIDPDKPGSQVKLPEGTFIVREVYDGGGALKKLTLMGKGARGYNSVVGDYWYGVTDPSGVPQVENGQTLTGKLEQCYSCHQARGEADDFLFGVPASARTADPPVSTPTQPTTPPPAPLPPPVIVPGPVCGDFACEGIESCAACPSDCCFVRPPPGDDHGGGGGDDDDDDDDHG